jgi:hypothetical protein
MDVSPMFDAKYHTCSTCAANHQTKLDSLLNILLPPNLDLVRKPTVSKFHCGAVQKDSTQDCELGRDSSGTSYRTHLGSHAEMGRHRQMRNGCKDLARSRRQCRNGVTGISQRKRNVGH